MEIEKISSVGPNKEVPGAKLLMDATLWGDAGHN
jgi:hypothetical protein